MKFKLNIISVETYFNKELQTGPLKKAINLHISCKERFYNLKLPVYLPIFNCFCRLKVQKLDGEVLLFLQKLQFQAPEFYYYRYAAGKLGLGGLRS